MSETYRSHAHRSVLVVRICLYLASCVVFSSSAKSPQPLPEQHPRNAWAPEPGRYVTERGWGQLEILRSGEALQFTLETVIGESGCSLEGDVEEGRGAARSEWVEGVCTVQFRPGNSGAIGVTPVDMTQCRKFCGYNGGIDGEYLLVPATCTESGLETARQHFKRLYDAGHYKTALSALSKVFSLCRATLTWQEEGEMRNDLALTQHHNGLDDACLDMLAPYAEDAAKDDEDAAQAWPPSLSDRYLRIVRAARTNLRLCRQD